LNLNAIENNKPWNLWQWGEGYGCGCVECAN